MEPSDIFRTIRDRLRRAVVDPGEQKLLDQLQELRGSERTLQAAAERGEQVEEELRKTRAQAAELVSRLPRGADLMYCALGVLCVLAVEVLTRMYHEFHACFIEMWGEPEVWMNNWWRREHRWGSIRIFQLGSSLASSIWPPVALSCLLVVLWFVQRRLRRWHARTLILALIVLQLLVSFVFWLTPFHLLIGPLIRGFR